MQSFVCGTRLCFGADAPAALAGLHAERVLLVTDPYFAENGTAARYAAAFPGAQVEIFSDVAPDPPLSLVAQGVARLQALRPDTVLDPALLEALPPRLIAESGMDAVSHCVEAAAAREASPVTDALAHSACQTLLRLLPRSFAGETAVRGDVHLAASMAALAFDNAGLGACHALAHALGGRFHVAHGRLCAMLLPHVIAHHAAEDPHPYAALAAACGLPGVRGLTGAIVRLRARLGLPASLPEAGVPREAVLEDEADVLKAALADPCAAQAPAPLTHDALQVLLRQVL